MSFLLITFAFLTGEHVLAVLGLVPLIIFGAVLFFLPAALWGNPYVRRIVSRLPQEAELTGLLHVCQISFYPRVYRGLRGWMEDADDVGRLCISEDAVSFSGDHVRFSLPFDCIKAVYGFRGFWLAERRIMIVTDIFPGYRGIQLRERESNTVMSSNRISRQIIDKLMNRTRQGAARDGDSTRVPSPPVN